MANIKYTHRVKTATGYDVLYPKTTADQIITDASMRFTSDEEMNGKAAQSSVDSIAMTADAAKTVTDTVNSNVGSSSNTASSGGSTLFALLKYMVSMFSEYWTTTRAGYIDGKISDRASQGSVDTINTTADTINTNTAVNNTASKTGTLSQKESYTHSLLENGTYGLSAIKSAITSAGASSLRTVYQKGRITSSTVYGQTVLNYSGKGTLRRIRLGLSGNTGETVNIIGSMKITADGVVIFEDENLYLAAGTTGGSTYFNAALNFYHDDATSGFNQMFKYKRFGGLGNGSSYSVTHDATHPVALDMYFTSSLKIQLSSSNTTLGYYSITYDKEV